MKLIDRSRTAKEKLHREGQTFAFSVLSHDPNDRPAIVPPLKFNNITC
jgi:hypothetical protein